MRYFEIIPGVGSILTITSKGGGPLRVRGSLREESHFKFGEINTLGSGGGTKPVNYIFWQKFQ